MTRSRLLAIATAALIALATGDVLARVKVQVEFDKSFDFTGVTTWDWDPAVRGEVMMARTAHDNADAMKQRAEPIILDAVATEMPRRRMTRAAADPHVTVRYFLLLTTNMSAQTVGQFLPGTTAWAVPPFAQATQSLEMQNQGSLVLDISAKGAVVWRGVAQTNIKLDATSEKRESLIREGVRDLLRRFPPKR
jgi:hypothetical protein